MFSFSFLRQRNRRFRRAPDAVWSTRARARSRCPACLQHPNEAHGVAQPCPRGFAPVLTGAIWAAAAELLPAVRQRADRYDAQGTRRQSTGKETKAPLSAIHRRSFPSLKAGYTVDAHIEALVDEGDVASSFVPGHCSRRKAPPSTLAFISPTAGRECSLRHR